jgi:hypothetical protein
MLLIAVKVDVVGIVTVPASVICCPFTVAVMPDTPLITDATACQETL